MKCPKCGFQQPAGLECIRCGIVFSKISKSQKQILADLAEQSAEMTETRPVPLEMQVPATGMHGGSGAATPPPGSPLPVAPSPPASYGTTRPDPLGQPIRPALRYLRLAAGLLAVGFGSLLFWAGEAMAPEPIEALLLIVYLCVGAYWVLSVTFPTPIRRFALEMVLLIVTTLGLRITSPHLFDTDRMTRSVKAAPGTGAAAKPEEGTDALAREAGRLCAAARSLLDGDLEDGSRWSEALTRADEAWKTLPDAVREKAEPGYILVGRLDRAVEAWRRSPDVETADEVRGILRELETWRW
ncbi:MAG: hypothetical protein FJ098_07300 [Deltaproteobacteria bacterium]|nr:hypothetical protein [Deltaproteobacteria bacterium]